MPIKRIITDTRVPVKIWTDDVEEEALAQLRNAGSLPFVFRHIAAMPDLHSGKGSTIGSVIATEGAIVPACVGVDLGCGMSAIHTDIKPEMLEGKLAALRHQIERSVPTGMSSHKDDRNLNLLDEGDRDNLVNRAKSIISRCNLDGKSTKVLRGVDKFPTQLGTLGGGNHFIEICISTNNEIWIMLHSGSRGVGNLIAQHHIDIAKGLMKQLFISLPDPDLSYLAENTKEFDDYINDMTWAQDFAKFNRKVMMKNIINQVQRMIGDFQIKMRVDCHHNYVEREHHFGKNVLVTRKGAIRAREGDLGIIPGSMGAKSFIVRGLGNPESFHSASHGAGRKMSRTKARKLFTEKDLAAQTIGVECRKDEAVVDEIPSCYKDIDEVLANESDLVEPIAQLKQILCVKGA